MKRPVPYACRKCKNSRTCTDMLKNTECDKFEYGPVFHEKVMENLDKKEAELCKLIDELQSDFSFSKLDAGELALLVMEGSESFETANRLLVGTSSSQESKSLFVRTCSKFHDVKKLKEFLDVYRWV